MRLTSSHLRERQDTGVQKSARVAEHARAVGEPREAPVGWLASEGSSCEIRSRAVGHVPGLSSSLVGS